MITKLTSKQKALFPVYRDKWIKIGLCTDRVDKKIAQEISNYLYEKILKKPKVPVIISPSPFSAWLEVCRKIEQQIWKQVWLQVEQAFEQGTKQQIKEEVKPRWQVKKKIDQQAQNQINIGIRQQINKMVEVQVALQVWQEVGQQVEQQVWHQIGSHIGKQIEQQIKGYIVTFFIIPYLCGHFNSGYLSYIDYCNQVLHVNLPCQEEDFDWYIKTSQVGLIYPLENCCIISDRPVEIHLKDEKLHNEKGMAIKYSDGFGVYCLNGVRVSKEIVMTPAEDLDPNLLLTERNIEIRREIIRKIGIDRILQKLGGKLLDVWREYELYRIENIDIEPMHILKMKCPSTGLIYCLRVPPNITKAYEARVWISNGRNPEEFLIET